MRREGTKDINALQASENFLRSLCLPFRSLKPSSSTTSRCVVHRWAACARSTARTLHVVFSLVNSTKCSFKTFFRFFADRAGNRSNLAAQRPAEPCHADCEEVTPRDPGHTAKRCLLLHVASDAVKRTICCLFSEQSRA